MGEEIRQNCALDTQAVKSRFSYSWWLCTKARWFQNYNIPKIDQNRGLRQLPELRWGKLQELHTCWQRRTERPNAKKEMSTQTPKVPQQRWYVVCCSTSWSFSRVAVPDCFNQGQCKTTCSTKISYVEPTSYIIQKKRRDTMQTILVVQVAVVEAKAKCQSFHIHWKHNLL